MRTPRTIAPALVRLLLIGCIGLVAAGCGSDGGGSTSDTAAGDDTSAPAGALELGGSREWAVTNVPDGIAAVAGDHDGHPAIAIGTSDGFGEWKVAEDVPRLAELVAWRDGDLVRVAGNRCEESDHTATSDANTRSVADCRPAPILALAYSLSKQAWEGPPTTVDTKGVATELERGTGSGPRVLAWLSEGRPGSGLAVVDVGSKSMSKLGGSVPLGPVGCPAGDTFLVAAQGPQLRGKAADRTSKSPGGDDRPFFGVVESGQVRPATIDQGDLPDDAERTSVNGCTGAGLVMAASWSKTKSHGYLIGPVGDDVSSLQVVPLPDAELKGSGVSYLSDLTSSTVIATRTVEGSEVPDQMIEFMTWDGEAGRWELGAKPLPAGANVAVGGTQRQYAAVLHGQVMWLEDLGS